MQLHIKAVEERAAAQGSESATEEEVNKFTQVPIPIILRLTKDDPDAGTSVSQSKPGHTDR